MTSTLHSRLVASISPIVVGVLVHSFRGVPCVIDTGRGRGAGFTPLTKGPGSEAGMMSTRS
jgi:hypothetical protein